MSCATQLATAHSTGYLIETGAHPVLTLTATATLQAHGLRIVASAASMRREEPGSAFWDGQRIMLDKTLGALDEPLLNPSTPQHQVSATALAVQVQEVLKSSYGLEVGLDASLMTCGLSSAKMLSFVGAINAAFGTQLPATLVLECGTLRAIANRLAHQSSMHLPATCNPSIKHGTRTQHRTLCSAASASQK